MTSKLPRFSLLLVSLTLGACLVVPLLPSEAAAGELYRSIRGQNYMRQQTKPSTAPARAYNPVGRRSRAGSLSMTNPYEAHRISYMHELRKHEVAMQRWESRMQSQVNRQREKREREEARTAQRQARFQQQTPSLQMQAKPADRSPQIDRAPGAQAQPETEASKPKVFTERTQEVHEAPRLTLGQRIQRLLFGAG